MISKSPVASGIPFDNATSGLTSLNVKDAIDEIVATLSDPFAQALFDYCAPLFDHDENCGVQLLKEC